MKTGLVSVSFRKLSAGVIVDLAVKCGLDGIEWGGDLHVPPGDIALARAVGAATRANGLEVACYGTYYRLTDAETEIAPAVIDTAKALGAPLIRVWAGVCGSRDASDAQREEICRNARAFVRLAAQAGIDVAFEWHGGTLTDSLDSALQLLADVPGAHTLWQPPVGMKPDECAAQIRAAAAHIRNIHVFSWEGTHRLPLQAGAGKWRVCMEEIRKLPGERYMLLEFVAEDDVRQLECDAQTLHRWLRGAWSE